MQIGGRWRLENRLQSIKVHTLPEFPVILASLHPAGGAMPTSCCVQDRIGKQWSLLCAATRPPTSSPTSAAHPKLAGASTGPEADGRKDCLSSPLQQEQLCVQTPQFLLWLSSGITLHHPPALQERGENSRPASADRENRPPLFPLPLLSVDWGTWSTPSSLLQQPLRASHSSFPPPSKSSSGWQSSRSSSENRGKISSECSTHVSFSFAHIKSLKSRLSLIKCYMEIVNLPGALRGGGVEREHKTHNITFHYPNLPLQKGAPLPSLPRSCFGQKRASLNALFSHRGVIRTRAIMAFPGQPWVIELEDCRVAKLRCVIIRTQQDRPHWPLLIHHLSKLPAAQNIQPNVTAQQPISRKTVSVMVWD